MPELPAARRIHVDRPFPLEHAGSLGSIEIAYETWGRLDAACGNAVLVVPAFSAHAHARSSAADPTRGWWEEMIGPGAPIDTDRWYVIAASNLGGCHGTTGPVSIDSRTGQAFGADFPLICIGDMARAHLLLLDGLGIERVHAVVGGSMGAMLAIELGLLHSTRVARVLAYSGTDFTRPATAAIRHLGRQAIMLDPDFAAGRYGAKLPRKGLGLARQLGTVFYRSKAEFNDRFSAKPIAKPSLTEPTFDVQSYLDHQSRKFLDVFDANAYLRLSLAMDLHDVTRTGRSVSELATAAESRFLIGGVFEDRLLPIVEQIGLRDALRAGGADVEWFETSSPVGHDAFLVETEIFGQSIRDFLTREV